MHTLADKFKTPDGQIDFVAVQQRWSELQEIFLKEQYTEAEYPELCAEAVELTRILRRTNTGPSKAKTSRSKRTSTAASINLLD